MSDEALCMEWVPDGGRMVSVHRCGRKVKRNGMCGIHAAAKERVINNDIARREKDDADRARMEKAIAGLAELGIEGQPHYSSIHSSYTGKVVLTLDNLRAAILAAKAEGWGQGRQAEGEAQFRDGGYGNVQHPDNPYHASIEQPEGER